MLILLEQSSDCALFYMNVIMPVIIMCLMNLTMMCF